MIFFLTSVKRCVVQSWRVDSQSPLMGIPLPYSWRHTSLPYMQISFTYGVIPFRTWKSEDGSAAPCEHHFVGVLWSIFASHENGVWNYQ